MDGPVALRNSDTLEQLLIEHGSDRAVGDRLGVSAPTVHYWRGKHELPTASSLKKMQGAASGPTPAANSAATPATSGGSHIRSVAASVLGTAAVVLRRLADRIGG